MCEISILLWHHSTYFPTLINMFHSLSWFITTHLEFIEFLRETVAVSDTLLSFFESFFDSVPEDMSYWDEFLSGVFTTGAAAVSLTHGQKRKKTACSGMCYVLLRCQDPLSKKIQPRNADLHIASNVYRYRCDQVYRFLLDKQKIFWSLGLLSIALYLRCTLTSYLPCLGLTWCPKRLLKSPVQHFRYFGTPAMQKTNMLQGFFGHILEMASVSVPNVPWKCVDFAIV